MAAPGATQEKTEALSWKIIPATAEHAPMLTAVALSVLYQKNTVDPEKGFLIYAGTPAEYRFRLAAGPNSVIALAADGTPLGFVLATPGTTLVQWVREGRARNDGLIRHMLRHDPESFLLIDQIAVTSAARGGGLAQAMLDAVLAAAAPAVIGATIVHAPLKNRRSIHFFEARNGLALIAEHQEGKIVFGYYERRLPPQIT